MLKCYMGIDPGGSGAIGVIDQDGGFVGVTKLDKTFEDIWIELKGYKDIYDIDFAILENVHSFPKQGVASAFNFGKSFGYCIGLITAIGIRYDYVSPGVWQKAIGCLTKGDKNVTKQKAQQYWPEVRITHATADALLIAEFTRRRRLGL